MFNEATEAEVLTFAPGQFWPEGKPILPGSKFHPRGYCTDPFVYDDTDGVRHMVYQFAVWNGSRWPTAIAHTTETSEGWLGPTEILRPIEMPEAEPIQFETPAVMQLDNQRDMLAVLEYQYYDGGKRIDRISTWEIGGGGAPKLLGRILPTTEWERQFSPPNKPNRVIGGASEPSLPLQAGKWTLCPYQAFNYNGGLTPTLMLAGSPDGGRTWKKHPVPVLADPRSMHGIGQPQVVHQDGVFHLVYQRRIKAMMEIVHCTSRNNMLTWREEGVLINNRRSNWRGRIAGACLVLTGPEPDLYFFGRQEFDEEKSPIDFGKVTLTYR